VERAMLLKPPRFLLGAILIAAAWYWIFRYRRETPPWDLCITFEDAPPPPFELLKLI
jgi:hypothetical protein